MPAAKSDHLERDKILAQVRERIVGYASSRVGAEDAEEVAQDTLLVLMGKYGHLHAPEDLIPLAITIMKFRIKEFRARARPWEPESDQTPDGAPDPEQSFRYQELKSDIFDAIAELGERCRMLFLLKVEGYTFAEIQDRMGAGSINTVYTWDFRCREQLREAIRKRKGTR
jgi:RNA polymerase sigma-70 factor (ECF subfamily)